jgi:hypothetical protein
VSRKRLNTTGLVSSPKKGPGVAKEIEDPLDTPPTSSPVFNPGYTEKASAKAIFKAVRKGKNKMVSIVLAFDMDSASNGALLRARLAAIWTLRRLIRDQSLDILFLSETKISPPQVSATLNRLGFFLMSEVVAIGISGGLVLTWRLGIDLECFVLNKNNISA